MKKLFIGLLILTSSSIFAEDKLYNFLGDCINEYPQTLNDVKTEYLNSTIWNYDNEYDVNDVYEKVEIINQYAAKVELALMDNKQVVEVALVKIFPKFSDDKKSKCDFIEVEKLY